MEILIAAIVSGVVQFLKNKMGTNKIGTLSILAMLSLASAGIYTYLNQKGYWESVYNIVIVASAIYAIIIKGFESE